MGKSKRGRPPSNQTLYEKINILKRERDDLAAHASEQTRRITNLVSQMCRIKEQRDKAISDRNDAHATLYRNYILSDLWKEKT